MATCIHPSIYPGLVSLILYTYAYMYMYFTYGQLRDGEREGEKEDSGSS